MVKCVGVVGFVSEFVDIFGVVFASYCVLFFVFLMG